MAMTDNALLVTIVDRVKRATRMREDMTAPLLSEELAVLDVPAWRVESAIFSLEHSRKLAIDENGVLHEMMPAANRGRP